MIDQKETVRINNKKQKLTESRLNWNVETSMQRDRQLYTGDSMSTIELHTAKDTSLPLVGV